MLRTTVFTQSGLGHVDEELPSVFAAVPHEYTEHSHSRRHASDSVRTAGTHSAANDLRSKLMSSVKGKAWFTAFNGTHQSAQAPRSVAQMRLLSLIVSEGHNFHYWNHFKAAKSKCRNLPTCWGSLGSFLSMGKFLILEIPSSWE